MNSVWEALAKLPENKRLEYLNLSKMPQIVRKKSQKTFGGIVYRLRQYEVPAEAVEAFLSYDPALESDD